MSLSISDAELDALRQVGDPEADGVVAEFHASTGLDPRLFVRHLVEHGLDETSIEGAMREHGPRGGDASALHKYLGAQTPFPCWVDLDLVRQGQEFFREFGLEIAAALFSASLPRSYTAKRGATVLTTTAGLVSTTRRRIAETGQMLLDIMTAEDSIEPLSQGTRAYEAARGVRFFHAAVRHMILNDPEVQWNTNGLGVPINQEDLLGTLAVFTIVVIESLDKVGVSYSNAYREGYFHLWLAIGHLMGIDYDAFRHGEARPECEPPLTYDEMRELCEEILRRNAGPSVEGRQLMAALLEESKDSMPFFLKGVPAAATRHLIGDESAEWLGVPRAGLTRLLFPVLRPFTRILSPLKQIYALGQFADKLTRNMYRLWIRRGRGSRPPWRFDDVRMSWKIDRLPTRAVRRVSNAVRAARSR